MEVQTSKLTRSALNWAVAKADGLVVNIDKTAGELVVFERDNWFTYNPSENGLRGVDIIDRWKIGIQYGLNGDEMWTATANLEPFDSMEGHTCLVAVARCLVANKLGDVVDIPDDVLALDPPEVTGPKLRF